MTDYWLSDKEDKLRGIFADSIKKLRPYAIAWSKAKNTTVEIQTGNLVPGPVLVTITKAKYVNGVEVPFKQATETTVDGKKYILKKGEWVKAEDNVPIMKRELTL